MKKYALSVFCLFSSLNGMEEQQITKREPREWDAQAYAKGNKPQELAAFQFLQESGIDLVNKRVLDVGCGSGNVTAHIAQSAKKVHGIDASNNMIEYAQTTYRDQKNLSFEHCFAEDIVAKKPYDAATLFFVFHWIENKQEALNAIGKSLKPGGEFLGTIITDQDQETFGYSVALKMFPIIQSTISLFKKMSIFDIMETSYPTNEKFLEMLKEAQLEVVSFERKTVDIPFKNRAEIEVFERALMLSRPLLRQLPDFIFKPLFEEYIDKLIAKLPQNPHGEYVYPLIKNMVIHARKVVNISDANNIQ